MKTNEKSDTETNKTGLARSKLCDFLAGYGIAEGFFDENFGSSDLKFSAYFNDDEDTESGDSVESMIDSGLRWSLLDQQGGEGQGDVYYLVYNFTLDKDSFIVKFDGHYQSYNGSTYDDWFFVEPVEKTITVYNKI